MAVGTDRPFVERITQFWTNHFAVSVDKQSAARAGRQLRARSHPAATCSATSATCCWRSSASGDAACTWTTTCPSGRTRRRRAAASARQTERKVGINENLAREILELHTLGVGGGYTQADVTTFAEVHHRLVDRRRAGRFAAGRARQVPLPRRAARARRRRSCSGKRYPDSGYGPGCRGAAGPGAPSLRPRASSPPSSRGISSPMIRRQRRSSDWPSAFTASERRPAHRVSRAHRDARRLDAAAREVQDAERLHHLRPIAASTCRSRMGRAPLAPFELLGQRT